MRRRRERRRREKEERERERNEKRRDGKEGEGEGKKGFMPVVLGSIRSGGNGSGKSLLRLSSFLLLFSSIS